MDQDVHGQMTDTDAGGIDDALSQMSDDYYVIDVDECNDSASDVDINVCSENASEKEDEVWDMLLATEQFSSLVAESSLDKKVQRVETTFQYQPVVKLKRLDPSVVKQLPAAQKSESRVPVDTHVAKNRYIFCIILHLSWQEHIAD